jgi:hypothetical protein
MITIPLLPPGQRATFGLLKGEKLLPLQKREVGRDLKLKKRIDDA